MEPTDPVHNKYLLNISFGPGTMLEIWDKAMEKKGTVFVFGKLCFSSVAENREQNKSTKLDGDEHCRVKGIAG